MIDPKPSDIGRLVVYRARYTGATPEQGTLACIDTEGVFVRFGTKIDTWCRREYLEWAHPDKPDKLVEAALIESILED